MNITGLLLLLGFLGIAALLIHNIVIKKRSTKDTITHITKEADKIIDLAVKKLEKKN